MDEIICPACNGTAGLLGQLGRLIHYTCRDCGMSISRPSTIDDAAGEPLSDKAAGLNGCDSRPAVNFNARVTVVVRADAQFLRIRLAGSVQKINLTKREHKQLTVGGVPEVIMIEEAR